MFILKIESRLRLRSVLEQEVGARLKAIDALCSLGGEDSVGALAEPGTSARRTQLANLVQMGGCRATTWHCIRLVMAISSSHAVT